MHNPHILLVEDDAKVSRLLSKFLTQNGFNISAVFNGEEAVPFIVGQQPDAVILDMVLPGIDGIEVCEAVRDQYASGILMLTAQEGDMNEVMALSAGVDDFMAKPVRPHVLLARLNRMLQRQIKADSAHNLELQDLTISLAKRKVLRNGEDLQLTDPEFELFRILLQKSGEITSREELFQKLKGHEYDGLDRAIDMRVSKLRQKLAENKPNADYIRTIRQRGYLLVRA